MHSPSTHAPPALSADPDGPRPASLGVLGWAYVAGVARPVEARPGSTAVARDRGSAIVVCGPTRLRRAAALERWYRRAARARLGALLATEAERLGVRPARLTIRAQRTRWGSCSTSGTVSLNWRLLLAPVAVARYVVVHELCHLRVPNHSRAFWDALEQALPEWRAGHQWLRRYETQLLRYRTIDSVP